MAKPTKPVSHYELRLYKRFGIQYKILPTEEWHGLRTHANIYCSIHKSSRFVWLQKVFNGRNSTWACRQCYLDSLKPTPYWIAPLLKQNCRKKVIIKYLSLNLYLMMVVIIIVLYVRLTLSVRR